MIVSLVGLQDTRVAAHRPGTDGAAVSVRVGGALVYMHDAATVSLVARTWNDMDRQALLLPREGDTRRVTPVRGVAEPAVMVEMASCPPVFARLERPVGKNSYLRVSTGRVLFDVRDLPAFRSTLLAFRRAEEVAATTFLPRPTQTARERAASTAARAFTAPAGPRRRTASAGRSAGVTTPAGPRTATSAERAM
ncbi:hypothetical protein [Pseudonocardia kunmingensis]|uniref:hypothetical protein n=1 Tax=Pseudonocardia kunmingensis TaxID=630975 RepID=UPI00114E0D2F|nr:hypothetical protein [Pseudonocardia kunmingensis]